MSLTTRIDNLESNLLINGGMDFNQRYGLAGVATGAQAGSGNQYTLDRWSIAGNQATSASITQALDAPAQAQANFNGQYCLKVTCTTPDASPAAGDLYQLHQWVEGYNYQQLHGRKARLQFWVKATVTGTYTVNLRNSAGSRMLIMPFTINNSLTWEKKFLDLPMDTAGVWAFDNTAGLGVRFTLVAGSSFQSGTTGVWQSSDIRAVPGQANAFSATNNVWQVTQVALVPQDLSQAGSNIDLPFFRHGRDIGDELRACMRYYEKSFETNTAPANGPNGTSFSTSVGVHVIIAPHRTFAPDGGAHDMVKFAVPKRAAPTMATYGNNTGQAWYFGCHGSTNVGSAWTSSMTAANGSVTGFAAANEVDNSNPTIYAIMHWTADAEL